MKILSIDGGGIKGLFSAAFLAGLEKRYGRQIADYFDLIAGTSTGGILALALAARLPAENIVEFYKKWGPKIFPTRLGFFFNLRSYLLAKYKNGVLIQALKDVFKELRIEDIYKDKRIALCIPSIDAISGSPWVFKTAHDSRLIRDNAYFLWEVALATSAAPTYFPLAKVKKPDSTASNLFVDGGLWANNPTLVALTEALTYGKSKIEDVSILSVGNIRTSTTFRSTTLLSKGVLLWRQKVVNLTLETQSIAVHNQVRLLFDSLNLSQNYVRVEHEVSSKAHQCLNKMDCAKKANLNDLEICGRDKANYEGVKDYMKNFFD